MTDSMAGRLRDELGVAVQDVDSAGRPRIAPASVETMSRALALASTEKWRVRIEGRRTWLPPDAPCDLVITTSGLDRVVRVAAPDLVATVEAGVTLEALTAALERQGMWLPWEPPGTADRSVGSVIATGTAGPLRHGFGSMRDHVLGCTIVTGDGRAVRPGGAVVKNVAGYDLTRLQVGAFGAFGVITEIHLRLRARPECDRTLVARGTRDDLTHTGRDLMEAAPGLSALELLSPALSGGTGWALVARLVGPVEGVEAEVARIRTLAGREWETLDTNRARTLWRTAAYEASRGAVTFRLGVLPDGLDDTLDLLAEHLDLGRVTAGAGSGSIRWSGDATGERLGALRQMLARREIPLTLERGPWAVRRAAGHFGAYREGIGGLVDNLRRVFDPERVFAVALEEADG